MAASDLVRAWYSRTRVFDDGNDGLPASCQRAVKALIASTRRLHSSSRDGVTKAKSVSMTLTRSTKT